MKLYTGLGPNPAVVASFIAQKGLDIPTVTVDLPSGENRKEPYLKLNPSGTAPCLELDDGFYLAEITAICEYLEEKHPNPPLIGSTPEERAECRMWMRRIDLGIVEPMTSGFRYAEGLGFFQNRMRCIPQAAGDLKTLAQEKLTWLDGLIAGRTWICGERFTLADILLFCFVRFGNAAGQPLNPDNTALAAWYARAEARLAQPAAA